MGQGVYSPGPNSQTEGGQEASGTGTSQEASTGRNRLDDCQGEYREKKEQADELVKSIRSDINTNVKQNELCLKCFYTNANSLVNKIEEFKQRVHGYDIIGVSETWFHSDIGNAEMALDGYNMYRVDRDHRHGGGVVLYIRDNFQSWLDTSLNSIGFTDTVWCTVKTASCKLLVGLCYRSPSSTAENDLRLLELLDLATQASIDGHMLLMGDFNLPDICYRDLKVDAGKNTMAYKFFKKSQDLFLIQNILEATWQRERFEPSVLDYVFSDEELLVDSLDYGVPLGKSDHVCLTWKYMIEASESETDQVKLNYWRGNYAMMSQELSAIKWEEEMKQQDVESAWNFFKASVHSVVNQYTPVKCTYKKKVNPWLTKRSRRLLKKRAAAWCKYKNFRTEANFIAYKKIRNKTNAQVKEDQTSYRKRILKSFKGQPKRFYGFMRQQKTVKEKVAQLKKSTGELTSTDKETVEVLSSYFSSVLVTEPDDVHRSVTLELDDQSTTSLFTEEAVLSKLRKLRVDKSQGPDGIHPMVLQRCADVVAKPLAILFQKSYDVGKLPADWKKAIISPIFKGGSRHEAENYRPVSLTSVPCKIMESILRDDLVKSFEASDFYQGCQHGFTRGRSTLTNLLESLEAWTRLIDEGHGIDVIFLDYRKAFDSVPHQRLLHKISELGVTRRMYGWLQDFLNSRKQSVAVNGHYSSWTDVISGVPQGSVLGPLLFLIFVGDLPLWIRNEIRMFADDTKIWSKITSDTDSLSLQEDVNALLRWSDKWLLRFNPKKCKVMHIGHQLNTQYTMNENDVVTTLQNVKEIKDLGVVFMDNLKPSTQCVKSAAKAQSVLGLIKRTFKNIDKEDFMTLYNTYIRPHMEYCIQVWSPWLVKDIDCLEKIQRRATKLVQSISKLKYPDRLRELGLYSLEQRRLRGDLIETYKILTKKERVSPETFFQLASTPYGLRGHSLKVHVPRFNTSVRKNFFSIRVLPHWNSLPQRVIEAPTTVTFKKRLDDHWTDMGII